MLELGRYSWPIPRLAEGITALATESGLAPRPAALPVSMPSPPLENLGRWIEAVANSLSLRADGISCPLDELDDFLRCSAPSAIRLPEPQGPGFLLLLGTVRHVVWVLGPDLARHALPRAQLRSALCSRWEEPLARSTSEFLEGASLTDRQRARALSAVVRQQVAGISIDDLWILRMPAAASLWRLAREGRLGRYLAGFMICHFTQYGLMVASWWLLGAGALQGRVDLGWLLGWALLLVTRIPLVALGTWYQGLVAARAGSLLKQRLLEGTFHLAPDEVTQQGVGHTLSRVLESEVMETLALGGGFLSLMAGIELLAASLVLALGAGGLVQALTLAAWIGVGYALCAHFLHHRRRWTALRLLLTRESTELMIGHRTRLAQQPMSQRLDVEDRQLAEYVDVSTVMDRAAARLSALLPRGWLLAGTLPLVPGFVAGSSTVAGLGVAIGGMLLAHRALERAVTGFTLLGDAFVAWREIATVFRAGAHRTAAGDPAAATAVASKAQRTVTASPGDGDGPLLDLHRVQFEYPERRIPLLRDCTFRLHDDDRVLLQAESGAGTSALVSLIGGLRAQSSGVLLVRGLDRRTLGPDAWARLVATVAQAHENHVFTGTLAFNLLMARRWPPGPTDLKEAHAVCQDLGLGELIQRMPGGLHQLVGDTGWQLSHGERARLFIARALLQNADLVVVDAALTALDPETLGRVLTSIATRARSAFVTTLAEDESP